MKKRANASAGSLSAGQQRLFDIARSLMFDPLLVLLDEPCMGLDPETLKQVLGTVTMMHDLGKTVLLVEQNARTGFKLSTRGVMMESRRVRLEGTHDEILNNPEISHLYLGSTLSGT